MMSQHLYTLDLGTRITGSLLNYNLCQRLIRAPKLLKMAYTSINVAIGRPKRLLSKQIHQCLISSRALN